MPKPVINVPTKEGASKLSAAANSSAIFSCQSKANLIEFEPTSDAELLTLLKIVQGGTPQDVEIDSMAKWIGTFTHPYPTHIEDLKEFQSEAFGKLNDG